MKSIRRLPGHFTGVAQIITEWVLLITQILRMCKDVSYFGWIIAVYHTQTIKLTPQWRIEQCFSVHVSNLYDYCAAVAASSSFFLYRRDVLVGCCRQCKQTSTYCRSLECHWKRCDKVSNGQLISTGKEITRFWSYFSDRPYFSVSRWEWLRIQWKFEFNLLNKGDSIDYWFAYECHV